MNEPRNKGRSVTNALPRRYRFTDGDGRPYAPFRLKPGVVLSEVVAASFPGEAADTAWGLEQVNRPRQGGEDD